jgi:hypothetical protein
MTLVLMFLMGISGYSQNCCETKCCPEVKCCEIKPKVVTRTKVVEKVIEKPVPFVVEKEAVKVVDRPVIVRIKEKAPKKLNTINILVGAGPTRIEMSPSKAKLLRESVLGVQYLRRSKSSSLNLGIQVQTNETVLGTIGFDF